MMCKLAHNHANIFPKQQTVCKMSDHELLSPDNSGSGRDNVFMAQKNNQQEGCNKNVLICISEKLNSQGMSIPDWRVF